jgi:hypothetical protein
MPERDDQRAQGDALHRDTVEVHRDQGAGHREHQHDADDQARCAAP